MGFLSRRVERKTLLTITVILLIVTAVLYFSRTSSKLPARGESGRGVLSSVGHALASLVQSKGGRKKIVYSCPRTGCGGWGDRQKGIVSAYVLAAMMKRDFGVSLTFPCDLGLFMTSNKVNWKVTSWELTGRGVARHSFLDKGGVAPLIEKFNSSRDLDKEFPSHVTAITWNMEMVKHLRRHSAAASLPLLAKERTVSDIYRDVLNQLFSLKPDLQKELQSFRDQVPKQSKLICVQVRLGNHEGFSDSETFNNIDQFPVVLNFLSKFNDSKKYKILVASDSEQVIQQAKKNFPAAILTLPGPITHSDKTTGSSACDGFRKTILDQYALSTCDVLVISESGLSKIASFLRGSDEELYIFHDGKIETFTRDQKFPNRVW